MATFVSSEKNASLALAPPQRRRRALALMAGIVLAGTGGIQSSEPSTKGYALPNVRIVDTRRASRTQSQLVFVISALKTTNAALARALGVSRQAIYNWLNGAQPSALVQARIDQLHAAAQLLTAASHAVRPLLAQPFKHGKNFWQLMATGENPEVLAQALVERQSSNQSQRQLLAERVAAKRARGNFSFNEPDDLG